MSKTVGKFRKQKNYQEDEYYEKDYSKAKKRSKHERTQLKRLRSEEFPDYLYGDLKRIK